MQTIQLDDHSVNLVFFTDLHLAATAIGRRTGNYATQILAKVAFVRQLAHKVKGVGICGGDVYHFKNPKSTANSHGLVNDTIAAFSVFPFGKVFGVVGNHDIEYDRMESISSQPLGTLIEAKVYHELSRESVLFENCDRMLRIQVDAYPYDGDDLAALRRVLDAPPREKGVHYRVVVMHQYSDPGVEPTLFGKKIIGFDKMAKCDYDLALWGHNHSRTETLKIGKCTHVRLGSLSRASLDYDVINRPVAAAVIKFMPEGPTIEEVELPVEPIEVAFTAADKAVEIAAIRKTGEVAAFLDQMDQAMSSIESTDPNEVLASLAGDDRELLEFTRQLCGL